MKKISIKILDIKHKQKIAEYTQQVIKYNFSEPLQNTEKILHNSVNFFLDPSMGEGILQQTLLKGLFPRLSYKRGAIMDKMKPHISTKIEMEAPNSKADFRLIGETMTASRLAETSTVIKKISMNFEDPSNLNKITTGSTNINPDLIIKFDTPFQITPDIKAGNNADNPFSNVVASIPYTADGRNYYVINNKSIDLMQVQLVRLDKIKSISDSSQDAIIRELSIHVGHLCSEHLDIIQKNILIQQHLLKAISMGVNIGTPSFYVAYIVPNVTNVNNKFFQQLEPYINTEMFSNKQNFNIYMKKALLYYNENIHEIAKEVKSNKQLLKESGLYQIADEIFT